MRNLEELRRLRVEIARHGLKKNDVALALGIEQSRFSRILSGARPMPEGFCGRLAEAIAKVKRNRAADEAYRIALAGDVETGEVQPVGTD